MVEFDLWKESFIFGVVFAFLIFIPCVIVAIMGKNMINRLGQYPSKTPFIQMSVFFQLVTVETITFVLLIGFYNIFASK